jgi:hypothetical protein
METWQVVGEDDNTEWSVARNIQTKTDAQLIARTFSEKEEADNITYRIEKEPTDPKASA